MAKFKSLNGKKVGTRKVYGLDINKPFSHSISSRKKNEPWLVPSAFYDWKVFDDNHKSIPYGMYLLRSGSYGNPLTGVMYVHNMYDYKTMKYLLQMKYITFYDITRVMIVKHLLPYDFFNQ